VDVFDKQKLVILKYQSLIENNCFLTEKLSTGNKHLSSICGTYQTY